MILTTIINEPSHHQPLLWPTKPLPYIYCSFFFDKREPTNNNKWPLCGRPITWMDFTLPHPSLATFRFGPSRSDSAVGNLKHLFSAQFWEGHCWQANEEGKRRKPPQSVFVPPSPHNTHTHNHPQEPTSTNLKSRTWIITLSIWSHFNKHYDSVPWFWPSLLVLGSNFRGIYKRRRMAERKRTMMKRDKVDQKQRPAEKLPGITTTPCRWTVFHVRGLEWCQRHRTSTNNHGSQCVVAGTGEGWIEAWPQRVQSCQKSWEYQNDKMTKIGFIPTTDSPPILCWMSLLLFSSLLHSQSKLTSYGPDFFYEMWFGLNRSCSLIWDPFGQN